MQAFLMTITRHRLRHSCLKCLVFPVIRFITISNFHSDSCFFSSSTVCVYGSTFGYCLHDDIQLNHVMLILVFFSWLFDWCPVFLCDDMSCTWIMHWIVLCPFLYSTPTRTWQAQRQGKSAIFKAHVRTRKGAVKLRPLDFAEKHGYIRGVVKEILHDPGRGAPVAKVQFCASKMCWFRKIFVL